MVLAQEEKGADKTASVSSRKDIASFFVGQGLIVQPDAIDHILSLGLDCSLVAEKCKARGSLFVSRELLVDLFGEKDEEKKELPEPERHSQENETDPEPRIVVKRTRRVIARDYKASVRVITKYENETCNSSVDDFVALFRDRYEALRRILAGRPSLRGLRSMGQLSRWASEDEVSVIGIVSSISTTRNGHTIVRLEDNTGEVDAIITKGKNIGEDLLCEDEVVGMRGAVRRGTLFPDEIVFPDVEPKQPGRAEDPVSAVFISDLHFGSNKYIKKIEERFLSWLKRGEGLASSVKYVCIAGDIVDGVGIYPGQEKELAIQDIYAQYNAFSRFLDEFPDHIHVIVAPGNHDAVLQSEPQPPLDRHLVPDLVDRDNVHLVPNPAMVRLHDTRQGGVDVLMYHGYSFTKLINAVPAIRPYGATRPVHVMRLVLQKRHLAPLYGSNILKPGKRDHLVVRQVPDILHTGDLHSFGISRYKGVDLFSTSTFQDQTSFMDRVGHRAVPGKVVVSRLDEREVLFEDFYPEVKVVP